VACSANSFRVSDPVAHSSGPTYFSREASDETVRPQLVVRLSDGQSEIVQAEADTYVRGGSYPGQNFGTSSWLYIRNAGAGAGNTRESYFRFNLSGISGEIEQATVRLRLTGNMTVAGMTARGDRLIERADCSRGGRRIKSREKRGPLRGHYGSFFFCATA
jgi:hypothetical protein